MEFQLTASRRGWQQVVEQIHVVSDISTHSLTKRLTSGDYFKWVTLAISTHSLTKRLTNRNPETYCSKIFQLTASRRGWLSFSEYFWLTRIFQLTASRRGWPAKNDGEHTLDAFQLTASRRGWRHRRCTVKLYGTISTHSLTKRLTAIKRNHWFVYRFQLTASRRGWHVRSLRCIPWIYFNSQPHEEADWWDLSQWRSLTYFNSQPHEEADSANYVWGAYLYISTHSLTKRLTTVEKEPVPAAGISTHSLTKRLTAFAFFVFYDEIIFQLTASRRGWLNCATNICWIIVISTHSLTKRLTSLWFRKCGFVMYFNSQPHEEADRFLRSRSP